MNEEHERDERQRSGEIWRKILNFFAWMWGALGVASAAILAKNDQPLPFALACLSIIVAVPPSWRFLRRRGLRLNSYLRATLAIGFWLAAAWIAPASPRASSANSVASIEAMSNEMVTMGGECGARSTQTNIDRGVRSEGSFLRKFPHDKSGLVLAEVEEEEVPYPVMAKTQIREECRIAGWSRVRVLAPSNFRDVSGWMPSTVLTAIKTNGDGRRVYRPEDFSWDDKNQGVKVAIVSALNKVFEQNSACDAYDPRGLSIWGVPGDQTIYASCVSAGGDLQFKFAMADVKKGSKIAPYAIPAEKASLAAPIQPLAKSEAYASCRDAILDRLNHPSTADFNLWDTTIEQSGNETRFSVGFTAKNSFGLELKHLGNCVFDGAKITLVHIEESR